MADKPKKKKRGPYGRFKYDQEIDHEYVEKQWLKYEKSMQQKKQQNSQIMVRNFRLNISRQEYKRKRLLEKPASFFLEKSSAVDEFFGVVVAQLNLEEIPVIFKNVYIFFFVNNNSDFLMKSRKYLLCYNVF